ncbi:MAG: AAA family ATPase [Clostridia bacterium]|nr:AAA family ATPase [Clostridia bacterium]
MILWINGTFGSGKTQTAEELHRRIPGSFVYDPENVGFWIRANEPKSLQKDNFQDEPLWRSVNRDMLLHLAANYRGTILVPMTLVSTQYYREIITAVRENGTDLRHFLLYPSTETVKKRLASRGEFKNSWAWQQIGRCYEAFEDPVFENRIVNDGMTISETAEAIAEAAEIELTRRDGRWSQTMNQLKTTIRAIRK